jgi:hypothetical protein
MAHDHDSHAHAAPSTPPAVSGPLAYPGVLAWILGIATGVGFVGLLYVSASHHEGGGHEAAPGAAPAAGAEAAPAH